MRCLSCNSENPAGKRFCGDCGSPLSAGAAAKHASSASAVTALRAITVSTREAGDEDPAGERKTVTALFADIKGSMELMEDLDPEEARVIVDPALRLMIDAVHRYDGYIVQSTGDGIFALFGAPVAHEDHPQRALYAALRIQEELRQYSARMRTAGHQPVEARVGVNTGEVVVRSIKTEDVHTEYTAIGHSTSLAARMQALAPTGSIATTDRTRKLCEGYFTFKSLGPSRVKGVSEPVNVHEVLGLGPLRTRLQAAARRGLTRFVGREGELARMRQALEWAREGRGQIVAAMGEPGVGKSRLFFEFKAIAQSGCLVLEAYSVSHGKATAYLPVVELVNSYAGIAADDDARRRREKIAGKVVMLERGLEDTLPYLFALLGIEETPGALAQMDAQIRRRRTLDAIKRVLLRESLNQPLIVVFEDLHWIDGETQALLDLLVEGLAEARILLLVNYRPEYRHQWSSQSCYTQLRLDPLGIASAHEMLDALLGVPLAPADVSAGASGTHGRGGEAATAPSPSSAPASADQSADAGAEPAPGSSLPLPDQGEGRGVGIAPLKQLIIERTEGNPFFMEEMVQALLEQGALVRNGTLRLTTPLNQLRVPATVQALLAARIDRLPPAHKQLLQTLAVVGREFPLPLIRLVTQLADDELERMLAGLQAGEFINEQPAIPDVEYTFKHALTQEVAYNSMLAERRRLWHERTAQAIEALFAGRLDDHVAELAHHYDRGGNVPKAVEYLGRAGVRAAAQVAHAEAVAYFSRALELLKQLPDNSDRDRTELDLQIVLGWSLHVARGPGAPDRERVLLRAQELCERLDDNLRLIEVLLGIIQFRLTRRDHRQALKLAHATVELAGRIDAPAQVTQAAQYLFSAVLFTAGELEQAREHLERAEAIRTPGDAFPSSGVSQFVVRRGNLLGQVLAHLGYPAAALAESGRLLARAQQLSDPAVIANTLLMDAVIRATLRDDKLMERAEEMISFSAEHGLPFYVTEATLCRGWALTLSGRAEEGIVEIRRSIASAQATGGGPITGSCAFLAEACARNHRPEEGLTAVAEGLAVVERTGERFSEAELRRVKGELMMMQDASTEAEAEHCLRTAIEVARRQRARLFELRATASLARLLKRRGKIAEARAMLAAIYNWFTEGFDSTDLKDAKALLDELAQ